MVRKTVDVMTVIWVYVAGFILIPAGLLYFLHERAPLFRVEDADGNFVVIGFLALIALVLLFTAGQETMKGLDIPYRLRRVTTMVLMLMYPLGGYLTVYWYAAANAPADQLVPTIARGMLMYYISALVILVNFTLAYIGVRYAESRKARTGA